MNFGGDFLFTVPPQANLPAMFLFISLAFLCFPVNPSPSEPSEVRFQPSKQFNWVPAMQEAQELRTVLDEQLKRQETRSKTTCPGHAENLLGSFADFWAPQFR